MTLSGVNGGSIAEGDVELGVRQPTTVHFDGLLAEVDALRREPQLVECSFYAQVADEAVGVDLGLLQRELLDDDPLLEQWQ